MYIQLKSKEIDITGKLSMAVDRVRAEMQLLWRRSKHCQNRSEVNGIGKEMNSKLKEKTGWKIYSGAFISRLFTNFNPYWPNK